jgi:hypothetical protein
MSHAFGGTAYLLMLGVAGDASFHSHLLDSQILLNFLTIRGVHSFQASQLTLAGTTLLLQKVAGV